MNLEASTLNPKAHTLNIKARTTGLICSEVDDQLVVLDTETHKTHCLNSVTRFIWQSANQEHSKAELLKALKQALQDPAKYPAYTKQDPEVLLELALDLLHEANLLESPTVEKKDFLQTDYSRRDFVQKMGLGAAATLVATILVPSPASAASCGLQGATCSTVPVDSCCTLQFHFCGNLDMNGNGICG